MHLKPDSPQTSSSHQSVLGLMGKYWEAGQVKTRLGATIGLVQSAQLYRRFVEHLCNQLKSAGDRRELVLSPASNIPLAEHDLSNWGVPQWSVSPQAEGDLGNRMQTWFEGQLASEGMATACESGDSHVPTHADVAILIGGDCPLLPSELIERAFAELLDHDVVIGPTVDGGYYLIGLRGPWRSSMGRLFSQMQWSQSDVFSISQQRAEQAGLSMKVLQEEEDVDTVEELKKLRKRMDVQLATGSKDSSDSSGLKRLHDTMVEVMDHDRLIEDGVGEPE